MRIEKLVFKDDGFIPNSPFPVIVKRKAIDFGLDSMEVASGKLEERATQKGWVIAWNWKVYKRPHYHSTTHEALVVNRGAALLRVGGHRVGEYVLVMPGDAIILPAGVAHQVVWISDTFQVFGLYPKGSKKWDMRYGKKKERTSALANIRNLSAPPTFI